MKRIAVASVALLALFVPSLAQGQPVTRQHAKEYKSLYWKARKQFGPSTVGCNLLGPVGSCHQRPSDEAVTKSLVTLNNFFAPPPAPAQPAPAAQSSPTQTTSTSYSGGGGLADVPGVPASFAACVATRESSNGAGSSNIYGILGGGGDGSLASQKAAFSQMYAAHGTQPWAPYDGC